MNRRQSFAASAALAITVAGAKGATQDTSEARRIEHNRRIVERYFDEVWNQGKLEILDELLSPHYVNHTPSAGDPPPGPDGLKPIVAAIRDAFPDLAFEIEDIVVTSHAAAVRVVMRGTHRGELFGTPPTGRRIVVNQINIERFVDGRIAEHWRVTDELAMHRQLGLDP